MTHLIRALFFVSALIAGQAFAADSISVDTLASQIEAGKAPMVIDVRSEDEYLAGHIPGARLIPHDKMADYVDSLSGLKEDTIVVYCRSGKRASKAAEVLEANGFSDVTILEGSFQAWSEAGKPVTK